MIKNLIVNVKEINDKVITNYTIFVIYITFHISLSKRITGFIDNIVTQVEGLTQNRHCKNTHKTVFTSDAICENLCSLAFHHNSGLTLMQFSCLDKYLLNFNRETLF